LSCDTTGKTLSISEIDTRLTVSVREISFRVRNRPGAIGSTNPTLSIDSLF
jgi:hypothetical protein